MCTMREPNTEDLRKAAQAIYIATDERVAADIAGKLRWAADEIDRLRRMCSFNGIPT